MNVLSPRSGCRGPCNTVVSCTGHTHQHINIHIGIELLLAMPRHAGSGHVCMPWLLSQSSAPPGVGAAVCCGTAAVFSPRLFLTPAPGITNSIATRQVSNKCPSRSINRNGCAICIISIFRISRANFETEAGFCRTDPSRA